MADLRAELLERIDRALAVYQTAWMEEQHRKDMLTLLRALRAEVERHDDTVIGVRCQCGYLEPCRYLRSPTWLAIRRVAGALEELK